MWTFSLLNNKRYYILKFKIVNLLTIQPPYLKSLKGKCMNLSSKLKLQTLTWVKFVTMEPNHRRETFIEERKKKDG